MTALLDAPSLEAHSEGPGTEITGPEQAFIEVEAPSHAMARGCAFVILKDNEVVGRIDHKATARFRVSPGWHIMEAKLDWLRTRTVSVMVEKDDVIRFRCGFDPAMVRLCKNLFEVFVIMMTLSTLALGLSNVFPDHKQIIAWIIIYGGGFPCVVVLGLGELMVLFKVMPWRPAGTVIRLDQLPHRDRKS